MKKWDYKTTNKYTGLDYNPEGISKEDGYNCLSLCLDFCKNEYDMPYTFEDQITGDISWKNVVKLFKDNPKEVFKELERHFSNYYDIIPPHQMKKGDIIILDSGNGIKTPCVFAGGNKVLITRKEKVEVALKKGDKPIAIKNGIKVISLNGLNIFEVYRVREKPRKITTKAIYKLNDETDKLELIEEDSYLYDGEVAECVIDWAFVGAIAAIVSLIISLITAIWAYFNQPETPDDLDIGRQINTRSTKEPLKVVYGLQKVGGNDVFMETRGDYHRDLYIIQTLSEGECEGINQKDSIDQIFIDDHLPSYFGSKVSYQFYSGSSTQTYDTTINAVNSDYTDNMRHTCYIRWYFQHDKDLYVAGKPTRLLELKGKKVLDFRDDTTAWSDNGILCLYDFFINDRYGLKGCTADQIDITSWTVAANYFDSKGWSFNYITSGNKNTWIVAQDIMTHFRCNISWFDGKYYLLIADLNEESSVMTIEDKHIVQDESGKAEIRLTQPNRFNKPKGLKVKFIDKDKSYTEDTILIGEESGVVKSISLMGYTDRETVCNIATYQLERARLNRTISGTFRDDCLELAPHDLITFNSTALAISDQAMRVISTSYAGNGLINLSLQYESLELYDDDYDASIEGTYTCNLPNPNVVIQIQNPQITEETFYYRLRTESRLHITFTVPEEATWFKHCEVWQAITTSTGTVPDEADYEHQFNTTNDFNIDHVEQGQKYYIVLISVSIFDVKECFDSAPKLSHLVVGNSDAPQSLSYLSAIPSNNSLTLFSDKLDDPDIEVYEFRVGMETAPWNGSVFLSAKRSPQESLPGVKPGIHRFWCNTKGTNGLYGTDPQYANATLIDPTGWSLSTSFTDDYISAPTGRVFDNTEHTTYASDDYLMCSHTSDVLYGYYYSREFDTGVTAAEYYMYLEADVVVTDGGTTWNGAIPSPNTWNSIGITTKSWSEIFEVEEAPRVDITIFYKKLSGDGWSEMKNAEILSAIVNARYFKVKIEITDPSSETYAQVEHFILNLFTKT